MKYLKYFEFYRPYIPMMSPDEREKVDAMKKEEEEDRLKPIENKSIKPPKHRKSFLYHVTNIKNLYDIKRFGLLPDFGDTLKDAYAGYYDFDGDSQDEEVVPIDFEGILFFSDKPILHYSQIERREFKFDECLLVIVEKNDSIFHKVNDYPTFTDFENQKIYDVDGISVYNLPIFIESGDWFSFEEQSYKYLLWGENLKNFLLKNFPELI
jgi:hypothetical protein